MLYKNFQMENMLTALKTLLPHRDKVGYVAARNTRILNDTLVEYFEFKNELVQKYGVQDVDKITGNVVPTYTITQDSPNFVPFMEEFSKLKDIEHDINLMTLTYDDVIGVLNGQEILEFEFMLVDPD